MGGRGSEGEYTVDPSPYFADDGLAQGPGSEARACLVVFADAGVTAGEPVIGVRAAGPDAKGLVVFFPRCNRIRWDWAGDLLAHVHAPKAPARFVDKGHGAADDRLHLSIHQSEG